MHEECCPLWCDAVKCGINVLTFQGILQTSHMSGKQISICRSIGTKTRAPLSLAFFCSWIALPPLSSTCIRTYSAQSHYLHTYVQCTVPLLAYVRTVHSPTTCTRTYSAQSHYLHTYVQCTVPLLEHVRTVHSPTTWTRTYSAQSHYLHTYVQCTVPLLAHVRTVYSPTTNITTVTKQHGIYARLAYYTASSGNPLPTFRDNVLVPSSSVKKYKKDYHSTLRNTPEARTSHQHRGGSLKSRILFLTPNGKFLSFGTVVTVLKNRAEIIFLSTILVLTPNRWFFSCATVAFSEWYDATFQMITVRSNTRMSSSASVMGP
jgi:hypothetical protein